MNFRLTTDLLRHVVKKASNPLVGFPSLQSKGISPLLIAVFVFHQLHCIYQWQNMLPNWCTHPYFCLQQAKFNHICHVHSFRCALHMSDSWKNCHLATLSRNFESDILWRTRETTVRQATSTTRSLPLISDCWHQRT